MKTPNCPNCGKVFTYNYGARIWNPWNHKCSECGTQLQVNQKGSIIYILILILGVIIGCIPIYLEEIGMWNTRHSLMFLGSGILALFVFSFFTWKYIDFTVKEKQT